MFSLPPDLRKLGGFSIFVRFECFSIIRTVFVKIRRVSDYPPDLLSLRKT